MASETPVESPEAEVTAGSISGASELSADEVVLADTSVWELAQKGNRQAEATLGELADASRPANVLDRGWRGHVRHADANVKCRGSSLATRGADLSVDVP